MMSRWTPSSGTPAGLMTEGDQHSAAGKPHESGFEAERTGQHRPGGGGRGPARRYLDGLQRAPRLGKPL